MSRMTLMAATASIALMIGAPTVTQAAEVNVGGAKVTVGGGNGGGVKAGASVGGAKASAKVGGGGGNVATGKASVGGNNARVSVGTGGGSLADVQSGGTPLNGGNNTDGDVNLGLGGSLFGNGPGVDDDGPDANGPNNGGNTPGVKRNDTVAAPAAVRSALADMSPGERATMKRKCADILSRPGAYEDSLIILCQVLRKL